MPRNPKSSLANRVVSTPQYLDDSDATHATPQAALAADLTALIGTMPIDVAFVVERLTQRAEEFAALLASYGVKPGFNWPPAIPPLPLDVPQAIR